MLGWWVKRLSGQASDVPSNIFFKISYRLGALKTLYFCKVIKKIIERIFAKNFARNHEKKSNTWNIRRLINDSFVPSSKRPIVLYCKLTDLSLPFTDAASSGLMCFIKIAHRGTYIQWTFSRVRQVTGTTQSVKMIESESYRHQSWWLPVINEECSNSFENVPWIGDAT